MFSFDDITKIRYFLPEYNSKLSLVTIDLNRNSLRLNWTIPKLKRYQKLVGTATIDNLQQAFLKAQQIELDIKQGIFDLTLNKYGLGEDQPILAIVQSNITVLPNLKLPNIKELWDWYKSIQDKTVSQSTKTKDWKFVTHYLSYLPSQTLVPRAANNCDYSKHQRLTDISPTKGFSQSFIKKVNKCQNTLFEFFSRSEVTTFEQAASQNAKPNFHLIEPRTMLRRINKADTMAFVG
jgi:hypothetical protein